MSLHVEARRVTFADETRLEDVCSVLSLSEYTQEEKERQWWDRVDMRVFSDDFTSFHQRPDRVGRDQRGLEYVYETTHEEVAARAKYQIWAVLGEQERQRHIGVQDEGKLSEVAEESSDGAKKRALTNASTVATESRRDRFAGKRMGAVRISRSKSDGEVSWKNSGWNSYREKKSDVKPSLVTRAKTT
uniref:Uncharacterized protein n=1 Tax=Pseudictyota dubia TaxID=2749911 RepID=A0A7R9Z0D8_9STRA|mmetsp:Transcript_17790/g.33079  ORF Transcript_17790/g.33079 Transcript_17790/m.33079 type:complete len:188 (+) Transcript_17790:156-719(+)